MSKILTTHVGSLPRSQKVVDFIFAREKGEAYDQAAFDAGIKSTVIETSFSLNINFHHPDIFTLL